MANQIINQTLALWSQGRRTKTSQNGWISGNAPCCIYNGESTDTRSRGGFIQNDNTLSYHCFNCRYKTSYIIGTPLTYKFRKLLSWLGAAESEIRLLVLEAIRVKDQHDILLPTTTKSTPIEPVDFQIKELPNTALSFQELVDYYNTDLPEQCVKIMSYVHNRAIDLSKYDFYWSPDTSNAFNRRVIVPFKWNEKTIGYTARAITRVVQPKYFTQHAPDYVFNVNMQLPKNKFVIVCEGPFDAMSIDGVAICKNECSIRQADIIDSLGKEIIVVPDFDCHINKNGQRVWPGAKLIDQAIEYNWSVSFPVWNETCKDINEATVRYGKLFVLKTILDAKTHNRLKIELYKRKFLNV